MKRYASQACGILFTSRFLIALAAAALVGYAAIGISAGRAHGQEPGSAPSDAERIVGKWKGQTEVDGVLTVTLTAEGRLGYHFTGGEKDNGFGVYELRGPDTLLYTPHDESDAEHWTYGFDDSSRLKLKMEEDNPKDVEQYTLERIP